jgi:tetratricopeptide (TPR) repeat protein
MDTAEAFIDAQMLVSKGETQEAHRSLDELLAAEPAHLGALLLKARLLLEARKDPEALIVLDRAATAWPRSAPALDARARCLHALGRNEEALAQAQEARALLNEGDNFRHAGCVYLTMVWCLRELRRYREALEVAEEGLRRTPDAVLAQWATQVEEDVARAERERC